VELDEKRIERPIAYMFLQIYPNPSMKRGLKDCTTSIHPLRNYGNLDEKRIERLPSTQIPAQPLSSLDEKRIESRLL